MILQLNPPIPLSTPKGDGLAWLVLDYGSEHNLMWTVAIAATKEVWTFSNSEVRAQKNITMGRDVTFPKPSDAFKGGVIINNPKPFDHETQKRILDKFKKEIAERSDDIKEEKKTIYPCLYCGKKEVFNASHLCRGCTGAANMNHAVQEIREKKKQEDDGNLNPPPPREPTLQERQQGCQHFFPVPEIKGVIPRCSLCGYLLGHPLPAARKEYNW